MGVDKEAMDIWKFGRSRPDLSIDETLAAPEPNITLDEVAERRWLINDRMEVFARGFMVGRKAGVAHANPSGTMPLTPG